MILSVISIQVALRSTEKWFLLSASVKFLYFFILLCVDSDIVDFLFSTTSNMICAIDGTACCMNIVSKKKLNLLIKTIKTSATVVETHQNNNCKHILTYHTTQN